MLPLVSVISSAVLCVGLLLLVDVVTVFSVSPEPADNQAVPLSVVRSPVDVSVLVSEKLSLQVFVKVHKGVEIVSTPASE